MKGTIVNFRGGKHTQYPTQMIIVTESKTREEAEKLVGKAVTFTTSSKKEIKGKVASAHGNSGALRVIFETGMPGQSISQKVDIKN